MCVSYQYSPTVAEGVSPNAARTPRAIVWLDVLELDVAAAALLGEASVEGLYATLTVLDQAVGAALGTASSQGSAAVHHSRAPRPLPTAAGPVRRDAMFLERERRRPPRGYWRRSGCGHLER